MASTSSKVWITLAAAFGTLVMLVWGMLWPDDFANRMQAIEAVPEPMWWLMGAVITFYFGAREAHHFRARAPIAAAPEAEEQARRNPPPSSGRRAAPRRPAPEDEPNAALDDWRRTLAARSTAGAPEAS